LLALSAIFVLPSALLESATAMRVAETFGGLPIVTPDGALTADRLTDADLHRLGDAALLYGLSTTVSGILGAVLAVGCAWIVGRDYRALPVGTGAALMASLRRALVAIAAVVLTMVATTAILVAGVGAAALAVAALPAAAGTGGPGVFLALVALVATALAVTTVAMRLAVTLPVAALEGAGPLRSLARSWRLTAGSTWRTFGVVLFVSVIVVVLASLVAELLAALLVDPLAGQLGAGSLGDLVMSALVSVVFASPTSVVLAVLYHDLVVRHDGWDVPEPGSAGAALDP
jgi:hypothetical protein